MNTKLLIQQINNLMFQYGETKVKYKWKKYIDNPKHNPKVLTQLDKHINNMIQYYGLDYIKKSLKDNNYDI